mmetsp:Transcript_2497/g.5292  ORF Transcript_2497/g.5292 Transcript_2497/m.5292 type:complete len:578 (+) Transcript_2497:119-1852(+)|eukprot:CAMPEP_0172313390 /NCGR_PEP_ID=MMETSP1058-20130122/20145_1 /TAXON_ID=83371 /ORGANISM="Detonula confervacea, Strain CCMP 353" /LENGTH=577 /DNA_ID=CAMNT_0013027035 /DNA_START=71 /DNA_END=1804 /DNA_ORIENTATION=+
MTFRIHATAVIFFAALLTESRAFAAIGGAPSSSIGSLSSLHKPLNVNDIHHNNRNKAARGHHYTKRAITQLRAGAAAAAEKDTKNTIPPPPPPTNLFLFKFYFPCLALWISGPLLSLVDTSFIGLSAKAGAIGASGSAAQLAALGPATTFIDGSLYLFAFLNVATTNLYASAVARSVSEKKNKEGVDELPGEGVVRTAAKSALYSGIGLTVFLLAVARPLIALYIGPEAAASPGLLDAAHEYVKIRALSMPTALLGGVLQAALLGAKDSVTPLVSILYSTIINVTGDYLLVSRLHMGLKGAAIATLLAQLAGTIAMIQPARKKLLSKGSSLGLLPRWITKRAPDGITSKTFLKFAAPVLTLILGKISAFGFMTNAAAGLPGQPATLAAHQIALSLFFFASPFMEVISQTAQSFLPTYGVLPEPSKGKSADPKEWKAASDRFVFRLEKVGLLVGALIATVVGSIVAFAPGIVTKDAAVQAAAKPLGAILAAGCFLTAPVAVSEGTLIAQKELTYLGGIYLVSTALLPPILRRIRADGGPLSHVWVCFAVFQLFRSACFVGRLLMTGKNGKKEADAATE